MSRLSLTAVLFGTLAITAGADAYELRLHGAASGARAVSGHQEREFDWGGAGFAAGELTLIPELGLQLELGTVMLSEGSEPRDSNIAPEGAGAALLGGVGVQVRPFANRERRSTSWLGGMWAATNAGATTTGGRERPMIDAHIGYDFLIDEGRYGIGPTAGLVHVFQPSSTLRPADANIFVLGVHMMLDGTNPAPPSTGAEEDRDSDGDGRLDSVDRCPSDPEDLDGFEDEDGCPEPDNDRDGVRDESDECPSAAEDIDGFEDEDGCVDEDNDGDDIVDERDQCPKKPEDLDGFEDEDGCPDADNDDDGLMDSEDQCPDEPETKNEYADDDGCPDEVSIRVIGQKIELDDKVHFRTSSAVLREVSYSLLERLAAFLVTHPEYVHVEIQGHTDQRGRPRFNNKLAQDRAESVRRFLVKHGVEPERLEAVGYGSSRPLVPEMNDYAWFMNRRVEFLVTRRVEKKIYRNGPLPNLERATESSEALPRGVADEESIDDLSSSPTGGER